MEEKIGVLLEDVEAQKHIVDGDKIETVYRIIKKDEKVTVCIYKTQNYFLLMPYYNITSSDGYYVCVNTRLIKIL